MSLTQDILQEVVDIDNEIVEDTTNKDVFVVSKSDNTHEAIFSYNERLDAFEKEWIEFLKKEITANIDTYFYVWLGMGAANMSFILKMEQLANKHFRGILTKDALLRLHIFVKQLKYGITAFLYASKMSKIELEPLLKFVEKFSKESFEAMSHWNWPLVYQDMRKLEPYRDEDFIEEPEFDRANNGGFPSWIHICEEDSDDSSNDSNTNEIQEEEKIEDQQ